MSNNIQSVNTLSSSVGKFVITLYHDESRISIICKGEEVASYNCSEEVAYIRYATICNFLVDVAECMKLDPTVFEWSK